MAKDSEATAKGDEKPEKTAGGQKVRVICEGFLGSKLLKKGDVTDDPEYVALIGNPRGLVAKV